MKIQIFQGHFIPGLESYISLALWFLQLQAFNPILKAFFVCITPCRVVDIALFLLLFIVSL